jgi:hypothetical protein
MSSLTKKWTGSICPPIEQNCSPRDGCKKLEGSMSNTSSGFTTAIFRRTCLAVTSLLAMSVTVAQAQLTNNPYVVNVTNTTAMAPIANGFGVAVLGYPMPTPGTNFFGNNLDGIAVSDAMSVGNNVQFYVADEDNIGGGVGHYSENIVGYLVLQSLSNPTNFTVMRSFVASIQTNSAVSPDSGFGANCAGGFGIGGVSKSGLITFRMDGNSAPASPTMAGEAVVVAPAQMPSTIIFTNAVETNTVLIANGGGILSIDAVGGNIPQIGQNNNLVAKASFNFYDYVARRDIFNNSLAPAVSAAPPNPSNGTNTQAIISGLGSVVGTFANFGTWTTRGALSINDTAKMMAQFIKSTADNGVTDGATGLGVIRYMDSGGPISITSLQTNKFGTPATGNWPTGGINTNAANFFSRTPFNGPATVSINDAGAVAFTVSINIDAATDVTNGTRAAQVQGILYQAPGSTNFLKVCDNTDPTLFLQVPVSCTNKTLISGVALDNYNNVYFESTWTNNTAFACDLFPTNALYEAVANNPTNPTSWTVRILLRQGDEFTNPASGDMLRIFALPYKQNPGPAGSTSQTISQRSFGPNAINRSTFPGHTVTGPSDPFAVGGIVVQATLTNLTRGVRSDALLYIGPFGTIGPPPPTPFVITSITRSGNDVTLVWNGLAGVNTIQAVSAGSYTNNYSDIGTVVLGSAGMTNFTDVGGASVPNRWYRIKAMQ